MLKIGIECEQLEGKRFGVGHTMAQLLRAITRVPGVEKRFKFVLYFKKSIPEDDFLSHPIFEKKITKISFLPASFNIFYHILLPFYYIKDNLSGVFLPSYMMPAFFVGKAIVVLTNDTYYEVKSGTLPFKYRISYKIFCWLAVKRAKKIMTISQFAKKELMDFYNIKENKIFVNPWGISEKFYKLERNEKNLKKIKEIKEKLGIRGDFIVSVGQAFPRRKMKESLKSFEMIANDFPNLQYIMACTDKYNPPIIDDLSKKINNKINRKAIVRVNYLDHSDILYLFNFAKGIIYISDSEAMGLPPIEGLACGTPSVVADNGLTREVFGSNAFFVKDTSNKKEISQKIKELLINKEKREKIISEADSCLNAFSWQKNAQRLLDNMEEVFKS